MFSLLKICGIFIWLICLADSARILGIFHMPAYSHFQLGDRIFKELAARGHDVTVISPYELKTSVKNLKHVVLTGFAEKMEEVKTNMFTVHDKGVFMTTIWMAKMGYHFTESVLNHENVQKLLNSNEKFDLLITEHFVNEALAGFSAHYKVPHIIVSTHGASRWTNSKMGNPHNPAYMPDVHLHYSNRMNFFQRTLNTLIYVVTEMCNHLYAYPNQNKLLQKYFKDSPHLNDLLYNTSLMLLNSHVSTNNPVPLVPNMIEIGGYHIQPQKPLPMDLQEYLDGAKDGFVFFSMGSNLRSRDMPEAQRNDILKALGKLKYKVLWKWEDDILPGQPPNVKLAKWLPQQDVLAHPNIKLFMTHGGMLSTIEAVYYGVPVLGLPVFGDQDLNVAVAENAGYGIGLPFKNVNEASLTAALNEMLNNPKYRKNVQQRSKIMRDEPLNPLERAVYWIEYVLRHNGAPHLKTAALNLHWYQLLLLDVIGVLTLGILVVLWALYKITKMLCWRKAKVSTNKSKKRN